MSGRTSCGFKLNIRSAGDAQIALVGDGSHGTYEFYAHRANITQGLIEEKGFTAVAVEADWPDAFRVNRCVALLSLPFCASLMQPRYIHGGDLNGQGIKDARDALKNFER